MFNCIESSALMNVCRALELPLGWYDNTVDNGDVCIVDDGQANYSHPVPAFRLSDYLLATAPVDVKEAR